MKTIYKFKLYHYRDGYGNDVFRAKKGVGFGMYFWLRKTYDHSIKYWSSRDAAVTFLTELVETWRLNALANETLKKHQKLTLIIVEKVEF